MQIRTKVWAVIGAGFLLLTYLGHFTAVNLFPPAAFWNYRYGDLPGLKDGVQSESYEISPVESIHYAIVRYNPAGNFFVVDGRRLRRFDGDGKQTYILPKGITYRQLANTPYYIDDVYLYDMSQETVTPEPLVHIFNATADAGMDRETWKEEFEAIYNRASAVTHFGHHAEFGKHISLLKIKEGWVAFFTPDSIVNITDNDFRGYTFEGYPEKYDPMIFLKDPDGAGYTDSTEWEDSHFTEDTLTYPRDQEIELMLFRKDIADKGVYLPVALEIFGRGAYYMRVGDEALEFQETAVKTMLSPPETGLSHFVLPTEYQSRTDVSFVKFDPSVRKGSTDTEGLYIVRPKTAN